MAFKYVFDRDLAKMHDCCNFLSFEFTCVNEYCLTDMIVLVSGLRIFDSKRTTLTF